MTAPELKLLRNLGGMMRQRRYVPGWRRLRPEIGERLVRKYDIGWGGRVLSANRRFSKSSEVVLASTWDDTNGLFLHLDRSESGREKLLEKIFKEEVSADDPEIDRQLGCLRPVYTNNIAAKWQVQLLLTAALDKVSYFRFSHWYYNWSGWQKLQPTFELELELSDLDLPDFVDAYLMADAEEALACRFLCDGILRDSVRRLYRGPKSPDDKRLPDNKRLSMAVKDLLLKYLLDEWWGVGETPFRD